MIAGDKINYKMLTITREKPLNKLMIFVATGFYAGYIPIAPGTAGSLIGIGLYLLLNGFSTAYYLLIISFLFIFGVYISNETEALFKKRDPSQVVFDEIIGMLVTMILLPAKSGWLVAGFFLFRFFDILKPYPIRNIEKRFNGGLGIMLDDVAAGIYANVLLQGVRLYVG